MASFRANAARRGEIVARVILRRHSKPSKEGRGNLSVAAAAIVSMSSSRALPSTGADHMPRRPASPVRRNHLEDKNLPRRPSSGRARHDRCSGFRDGRPSRRNLEERGRPSDDGPRARVVPGGRCRPGRPALVPLADVLDLVVPISWMPLTEPGRTGERLRRHGYALGGSSTARTSRTLRKSALMVNGFWRNASPGSSTPCWTMASSV